MVKITFMGAGSTAFAKNVLGGCMLTSCLHTAAELSIDDIVKMVDEMIEAHGDWMPKFK